MSGYRHRPVPASRHSRGFTLLELMITIIVAAILTGLALPSLRELMMRSNVTEVNNQLVLSLQTARAEAIRRGTWVEVVSVNNSNNWSSSGWQVAADINFDHVFDLPGADKLGIITNNAATPAKYSVCGKATSPTGIGGDARVIFSPAGTLTLSSQFDFNVNRPDGKSTMVQHITVFGSGEVKSVRGTTTGAPTNC